jgi:amidase
LPYVVVVATFITQFSPAGAGVRLAVKDLIDIEGVPTTAGSLAVAETVGPAVQDAACMAGAREAGAAVVGKTNLYELAFGASGVNEWFGTPRNPLDPTLVPGGSSSGSAVAVADGDARIAYGSDTGGSVRIPAAFCGTVGPAASRWPGCGRWPPVWTRSGRWRPA